jgi:arylsulfatase A-like enzyme
MLRCVVPALASLFAVTAHCSDPPRLGAAERPSVLFLFTDDQRADTIAALGNPHIQTPNLDRLARSGFVFDNAYCMGSTMGAVCNPSRHMLLSGRSLFRYDPQAKDGTFGDTLRKAGYETFHLSKRGNEARVYHTAFEHSGYLQDRQERESGHHGRTAADRTIAFLKNRDRRRPFFVYLGFAGPHDPRVAAEEWLSRYDRDRLPLPANYKPFHTFDNGEMLVRDEKLAPWPRTKDVVRQHLHDYYACITSIDHHIGRILQTLEDTGDFENTLIVFSSDHGLAIGSHGLFGKQSLYEHSMNSPLIFSGPGIPHGQSAALAYLFDIFPTVCELTGVAIPKSIEGRSLAPVIRGERDSVRETIFLAYRDVMRAVRRGDWKLIRYPQVDVTQLFNLAEDPHELRNLADDPQHTGRVAELMALLEQQQRHYADRAPLSVASPQPADVDIDTFFKDAEPSAGAGNR